VIERNRVRRNARNTSRLFFGSDSSFFRISLKRKNGNQIVTIGISMNLKLVLSISDSPKKKAVENNTKKRNGINNRTRKKPNVKSYRHFDCILKSGYRTFSNQNPSNPMNSNMTMRIATSNTPIQRPPLDL
jgi:hypothetical protein